MASANEDTPASYSFACGGWLEFYLFGVAKYMQEQNLQKGATLLGCSAGALTAAGLACNGDFDKAVEYCKYNCIPRVYGRLLGIFKLHEYVNDCLDFASNLKDYYTIAPGKLQVAITTLPSFKKSLTTSYSSAEDLKQCLLASSAAFPFARLVHLRGEWSVDGGFTDFQPVVDSSTITISPFYFSDTDIKPSRYVPLWWALFPPNNGETVDWIYNLGYEDARRWFSSGGRKAECDSTLSEQTGPTRCSHPFDTPRRISMHRFLGFDIANVTHSYVAAAMDLCLYLLLLILWKPFSVALIYAELLLVVVMHSLVSLGQELYDIGPMVCVASALFAPHLNLILWVTGLLVLHKMVIVGPSAATKLYDMWECVTCIGSLSLLLRILPSPPSVAPPNKHKHLSKRSLIYRIVRHFI